MRFRKAIPALLLLLLVGCGSTNLYVIDKQDFYEIQKGAAIGSQMSDRHGYFLSDLYMEKVVEAKVRRAK